MNDENPNVCIVPATGRVFRDSRLYAVQPVDGVFVRGVYGDGCGGVEQGK